MTLTVRLENRLEAALERHCAEHGVTKSLVVQESLAAYLMTTTPAQASAAATAAAPASPNYRAFAEAGLLGSVVLGGGADKVAVRAKAAERVAPRKARRSAA